jgi:hypothetical protein
MNVIVLEVAGLHPGFVGCYGAESPATPGVDGLAAEGIVFDQHYADSPGAPLRSSWTGRYRFPALEGTINPPPPPVLLEMLDREGVTNEFVTEASLEIGGEPDLATRLDSVLRAGTGALEGVRTESRWLVWIELPSLAPPWHLFEQGLDRKDSEEAVEPWLDPPIGEDVALDDADLQRLQQTYAEVLSLLDSALEPWLDELRERGTLDDALLCFISSSGLGLGEHGAVGLAAAAPYEEIVHLALILRLPKGASAGRRIPALTQPVDLVPSLLEALDLPVPEDLHGRSLWPLIRGESEEVRAYACAAQSDGERIGWLLRNPEWSLVLPGCPSQIGPRLFRKPDDRWEVNDVAQHFQPWTEHLQHTLFEFARAAGRAGPLHIPSLRDLDDILAEAVRAPE